MGMVHLYTCDKCHKEVKQPRELMPTDWVLANIIGQGKQFYWCRSCFRHISEGDPLIEPTPYPIIMPNPHTEFPLDKDEL